MVTVMKRTDLDDKRKEIQTDAEKEKQNYDVTDDIMKEIMTTRIQGSKVMCSVIMLIKC